MSVQETQNIDDYTIPEIAELFGLNQPYTESKLSTQFIAFLKQHKNIDDAHMIFLKDAYMKLKNYIEDDVEGGDNDENVNQDSNKIIPNENNIYLNGSHNIQEIPETIVGEESSIKYNPTQQIIQNNHPVDINYSNLNPLQRKTITKLVNIDSIFRENPTIIKSNDFLYNFKEDMKNVISYKIVSLELPNIWNTFSNDLRNNEFTVTVYNYSSGTRDSTSKIIYIPETTHQIIMPEGKYEVNELVSILNNLFLTTKDGLDFLLFEVDNNTGKSIFRCKNQYDTKYVNSPKAFQGTSATNVFYSPDFAFKINFDLQEDQVLRNQQINLINNTNCIEDLSGTDLVLYNTTFRELYHNFGYLLGFQKNEYYINYSNSITYNYISSAEITYNGFLKSEGYYGDSLNKYFFIKIDDFNKNTHSSIISPAMDNMITDNIIAKIPIDVGTFTMINNNSSDLILKERTFFGPVNIRKLKIQLTDRFNRLIDIGFSNYSLTLEFKILYS